MSNAFRIDGDVGSLKFLRSWFFIQIPSWVALLLAAPLLLLFIASLFIHASFLFPLVFGVSSFLFLLLWQSSRKISIKAGDMRIFKQSGEVSIVQRDGTEQLKQIGNFQCVTIAKVVGFEGYVWMAFLEGEAGELPLSVGFTFRRLLIRRVSPIAEWLRVPIKVSDHVKTIDLVASFQENKTVFQK